MPSTYKAWMMFVDGENLTIRAQELATKEGLDLADSSAFPLYHRDVFFWPKGLKANTHPWSQQAHVGSHAERAYYYTCMTGGENDLDAARDRLAAANFSPVVIQKIKGQRAKGVDISLTKDMLVQAFFKNYDVAVLAAGDGDYVPVVEEVKRLGKRVVVAFFEDSGLNPKLRRAADEFYPLRLTMT